jgi:hypothetical protein
VDRRAAQRNAAANSAADKHDDATAHGKIMTMRGRCRPLRAASRNKNSRPSGLFWGLPSHTMAAIDFRPDDISYPPVTAGLDADDPSKNSISPAHRKWASTLYT